MKFSIATWAFLYGQYTDDPWPLERILRWTKEAGFDGTEFCGFHMPSPEEEFDTPQKCRELVRLVEQNGLEVPCYAAWCRAAPPSTSSEECTRRPDSEPLMKMMKNTSWYVNCEVMEMKYTILDGREKMDIQDIIRLLKNTYWADQRSDCQIEKSVLNSACYGVYLEEEEKLAGFARVISDYATTYYLCDVVIDTEYQRKGLGTALVSYIESLPEYDGLRGILITRDAHSLYRKFGYEVLDGRVMVKGLNC